MQSTSADSCSHCTWTFLPKARLCHAQLQQEEVEEKKQEKEQELIDFWEVMADKLLDK